MKVEEKEMTEMEMGEPKGEEEDEEEEEEVVVVQITEKGP